jgi:hypothetical protein
LGYGLYQFSLDTAVDQLDPNVVFGFFSWTDDPTEHHREIDIEFSRWSAPSNPNNAQFVVQPFDAAGHLFAFREPAGVPQSTHQFSWTPTGVEFRSLRGYPPFTPEIARNINHAQFARSAEIPSPGDATAHFNLWLFNGVPPIDNQEVEIVVHDFQFTPAAPPVAIEKDGGKLYLAWPAGFVTFAAEAASALNGPWSPLIVSPVVSGGRIRLELPTTKATAFLRLKQAP